VSLALDIDESVRRIELVLAETPSDEQIAVLLREIAKLRPDLKNAVGGVALMTINAQRIQSADAATRFRMYERWGVAACGVLFVGVLICIALFVPDPSDFQYLVFRSVLALAAAGFAGLLPGVLEVHWSTTVRATEAFGVFVIVYFWNPAQLAVQHHLSH